MKRLLFVMILLGSLASAYAREATPATGEVASEVVQPADSAAASPAVAAG